MTQGPPADPLAEDAAAGVFGHRLALADFDAADVTSLRALAAHVRAVAAPGVDSAIAIAGSAAQGRIQPFPGDCDFYERVHVHAGSLEAARARLAEIVRATALRAIADPEVVLVEVNFGTYPWAAIERGVARAAGDPITWLPSDVAAGSMEVVSGGVPRRIGWHEVEAGTGWTYLGLLAAEPGRVVLASNMLDASWEGPGDAIVPLDGTIDACFQEVYLEIEARPLVERLLGSVDASAACYADLMRRQARHYAHEACDYCKASKRLYNLFRATGDLPSAAWVRELFDDPPMCLHQAPALLEAVEIAIDEQQKVDRSLVARTLAEVTSAVSSLMPPADCHELVRELRRVGQAIERGAALDGAGRSALAHAREGCRRHVSAYVRDRLLAFPRVASAVEALAHGT